MLISNNTCVDSYIQYRLRSQTSDLKLQEYIPTKQGNYNF